MKKYLIIGGIILFVLVMVVVSIILVGGQRRSNTNQEKIEIVWWKPFNDRSDFSDVIEAYQDIRPNVTIKYVKKDINNYEQELLEAIASGNTPDIFTIHNDWLPEHSDKMFPMPERLMSIRQYNETFVDAASLDFLKDNKIYAIPLSIDVLSLYYNKDILGSVGISTPPKTWPEVVAAVQKVTRQDSSGNFIRSGIAMGTSNNVNRAVDIVTLLMLQNGTLFYDNNNSRVTFDQQVRTGSESYYPGALALEFYTQFSDPAKKAYTWNSKADNSIDAFSQGKLAMMVGYSYMSPMIKAKAPNLNWGVSGVPQVDNTGLKVNFANYWGEGVSKFSAEAEYAWDFLRFLSEKESLKMIYAKNKVPSSRRDIIQEQISDTDIGVFAENVPTAKSIYKKDSGKFERIFLDMIESVILRNVDPEDAIDEAAQQVSILQRQ